MPSGSLDISSVLNNLLIKHGITEAELSRRIDAPRATINRLVSGRTPDPRASTLETIADYFKISVDQLLGKQPIYFNPSENISASVGTKLPIIDWDDIRNWKETIKELKTKQNNSWILVDSSIENGLFAFKINGESMWPNLQDNTIVIVDPERKPKNKDFVVVHIKAMDDIVVRQLIIEGKYTFLRASNPIFPVIQVGDNDDIIGVIVQTRNNYE
ncbi:S24 family peptidase [Fluoribacter gormanii]|uniref:S24 family peptidase n=1 Tax=Fluoribacter gormanii TaxID=464 RepID=UPI001041AF85|nr:S24 family peptidase [Fluoribacter gormanii]